MKSSSEEERGLRFPDGDLWECGRSWISGGLGNKLSALSTETGANNGLDSMFPAEHGAIP